MKITIEVTQKELNWIQKYFKAKTAIFDGELMHPAPLTDKILMRVLEVGIERGDDNEFKD